MRVESSKSDSVKTSESDDSVTGPTLEMILRKEEGKKIETFKVDGRFRVEFTMEEVRQKNLNGQGTIDETCNPGVSDKG